MGVLLIVFVACLIADAMETENFKEYVKNIEE